jgi:hypothetical protein
MLAPRTDGFELYLAHGVKGPGDIDGFMPDGTVNIKCSQCTVVAALSPVGGGYAYSVSKVELDRCPVIRERSLPQGQIVNDFDCDNLLDTVVSEYRRLLRR